MEKNQESVNYGLLNETECKQILVNCLGLNSKTEVNITKFNIKPINYETLGYLGEYYLLNITRKKQNNEINYEFFIKTLPVDNETHRELIKSIGVFDKEAQIYRTLFSDLKKYEVLKWHPDCYYARNDIIVMENLMKHNYIHLNETEMCSDKHVRIVLKTIASMHASSLVFEEKTSINIAEKYKSYFFEPTFISKNGWFNAGLQGIKLIASIHPKFQNPKDQEFIANKLIDSLQPIYEIVQTKKFRQTICHRDIWNKNMFFKYNDSTNEPEDCVMVDFQHCKPQPPAMDVVLFIFVCTFREQRNQYLEEWYQYYYNHLKAYVEKFDLDISKLIPWEEFRKSCDYVKLPCIVLSGIYAPLTYLSIDFVNNMKYKDPVKFNHIVDIDRNDFILEQMKVNSKEYKNILFEIVEELVELVKK